MKRDPAFALAVGSLERCLRVRERVGSSLISGRPGKPPGSGGFDTAVCETEFKGPVSDAAAPVEVVRRSGAVGGTAFRPISAGHGSACAVERALGETSKLGSLGKDGFVTTKRGLAKENEGGVRAALGQRGYFGAETAHVTAVESKRINGLLEGSESDFSKNLAESTAADESADSPRRVRSSAAHATAGESKGIVGSFQLSESEFLSLNSSCLVSLSSACARRFACSATAAAVRVCLVLHLLLCLLLLHARMLLPCMTHVPIRGRTRSGSRVPRAQGAPKVGFLVWPKICVPSQRWRQG